MEANFRLKKKEDKKSLFGFSLRKPERFFGRLKFRKMDDVTKYKTKMADIIRMGYTRN